MKKNSNHLRVKIHVRRLPRKNEAPFYYGKHIATVTKGERTLFVESSGELEIYLGRSEMKINGETARRQLHKDCYTDHSLAKVAANDRIVASNWFRIMEGETEVAIRHTYDEALNAAKKILAG